MKACRIKWFVYLLTGCLMIGISTSASAIALLLPAVQKARISASTQPPMVMIEPLGSHFNAESVGDLPIFSLGLLESTFDTTQTGDIFDVPTEMISMDLRGELPDAVPGSDAVDVLISLYPPDPIIPGLLTFSTTDVAADGSSAQGELKGQFNFIVEVALIDRNDPDKITKFMHEDMLTLFGLWRSEGNRLVIDSPIEVAGMIRGQVAAVPLPAAALLYLSGLVVLGLFRRRRRRFASPHSRLAGVRWSNLMHPGKSHCK